MSASSAVDPGSTSPPAATVIDQRPTRNLPRLLLVALLLPTCIAASNYALREYTRDASLPIQWAQFAWFVLQVGIVGVSVGRGISNPLLKWVVFSWNLLLINLLTAAQAIDAASFWRAEPQLPPAALMAGQMGFCVVWAWLGDTRWTWRWPGTLLAIGGLYFLWLSFDIGSDQQMWTELLLLNVATLSLLCGGLRLMRFRLLLLTEEETRPTGQNSSRPMQFGIRHVLIWTTALAILLGVAKGLDLLNWRAAQELVRLGLLTKLVVATTSAMVMVVALWAALGQGHWLLRYSASLILSLVLGGGLAMWSISKAFAARRAPMTAWSSQVHWELLRFYEIGWWWLGWLFLSGGLLVATLIILRVIGYRLVRRH